jgi:hypothetical protein
MASRKHSKSRAISDSKSKGISEESKSSKESKSRSRSCCGYPRYVGAAATPRPSLKLQAPTSAVSIPHLLLLNCHHPHISHDPRTRPLAGSTAAAAGCASPQCVVAPCPELEKAWLFERRSWSPPASVCPGLPSRAIRSRRLQLLLQVTRLSTAPSPGA